MSTIKRLRSGTLLVNLIIILLLSSFLIQAEEGAEPLADAPLLEEGYIQLNVGNSHVDSFFAVLFDQEGRVFLPLSQILEDLELQFRFDLANGLVNGYIPQLNELYQFDFVNATYNGSSKRVPVSRGKYTVINGEVYVTIDFIREWLPVDVEWDDFLLEVSLFPNFQLASDIIAERKEQRENLLLAQGMGDPVEVRKIPPLVFLPGNYRYQVSLSGGLQGFSGPDFTLGYVGSVLYGDFVGQVELTPAGLKLRTVQLKYRDVGPLKEMVVGNSLLELSSLLSPPVVMQGIRVQNMDDKYKYGATDLKGIVPPGSDVELFYQGMLICYQHVDDGVYRFDDIPVRGAYNVYDLIICTPEGRIYLDKQYVVARDQQLTQGQYSFWGGAGLAANGLTGSGQLHYGVNDWFTIGGLWTLLPGGEEKGQDNYLGSEAIIKLNPATMVLAEGHYELNRQDLKYQAGVKSVLGSWMLKGGVTGSTEDGQAIELEVEKGFNSQKIALVYRLENDESNLRHEVESRYQNQVNMELFIRLQNELAIEPGSSWSDLMSANLSYAGLPQVDVQANGQLFVNGGELDLYGVQIDVVSKRRIELPWYYSLGVQLYKNRYDLTGNIQYQFNDWLKIKGTVGLNLVNVSLSIGESRRLAWPMQKVKSEFFAMGWVEGRVYLDENGNHTYDEGEWTFQGVKILVNDQPQGVTGKNGAYLIQGLKPYQNVKIGVDVTTVDALYLPLTEGEVVELRPGSGLQLDFGLATCSGLSGQIRGFEQLGSSVGQVTVVLLDAHGQEMYRSTPEYDGFFIMEKIQPGEYWLKVIFENAPQGKILTPAQHRIEIPYGPMPVWYEGLKFDLQNG